MAIVKKSDLAPGAAFGKALSESEKRKKMLASIPAKYQKFLPPSKQTIGPKYQPPKSSVSKASPTVSAPSRPPMGSKGNPKTGGPMFGGPLAKGISNIANRISDNSSKIMAQSRAIESKNQATAAAARARASAPNQKPNSIAPLKPANIVPDYRKPATKAAPVARPVTKVAARPSAPVARTAAPVAKAPATRSMEPIKPMASLSVSAVETQPMGKREVDLSISTKKGNLFQRLGERIKQRQLARADRKSAGAPMKSTTSVPSTPTPSAPQAESGQGLSTVGKAMLSNYLSRKKYMGGGKMEYGMGGKMKSYAKGGMIEKEGMKPKGKMDKKKAFLEMIAKLKAKKK